MPPILGQPPVREDRGRRLEEALRIPLVTLAIQSLGTELIGSLKMLLVEASEGIRVQGPIAQLV